MYVYVKIKTLSSSYYRPHGPTGPNIDGLYLRQSSTTVGNHISLDSRTLILVTNFVRLRYLMIRFFYESIIYVVIRHLTLRIR